MKKQHAFLIFAFVVLAPLLPGCSPAQPRRANQIAQPTAQVGVHYFTWYRRTEGRRWGNGATDVHEGAPMPSLGWYNSNDREVMDAHITQMLAAGIDFAIVNIIADSPPSWAFAHRFFDRLPGKALRAAVMIDGLNTAPAATKASWVDKAKTEFASHTNYFRLREEPLILLFSASLDFETPGAQLRNVYWTRTYDAGRNTFNPAGALHPTDWPFWAPTPQPLINGIVPVMPGYDDTRLGRPTPMQHPRENGRTYHEQWQRALSLKPELVLIYGWNEYFEQTAIEPTDAWGDSYVTWTACYAAKARAGQTGRC